MRDSNEGMVEILATTRPIENAYACQAQIILVEEAIQLQFQVTQFEYVLPNKIISAQPFLPKSAGAYNYYFAGSYRKDDGKGKADMAIRVEQGKQHKQVWFESTKKLISNLIWLGIVKTEVEVHHLRYRH